MRETTVNVKITDVAPFKRFIAGIAQAHAHFYALTAEEMKALPDGAVCGVMGLQSALRELGMGPTGSFNDIGITSAEDMELRRAELRAGMHERPGRPR